MVRTDVNKASDTTPVANRAVVRRITCVPNIKQLSPGLEIPANLLDTALKQDNSNNVSPPLTKM
jgi:hypothetical protein